MRSSLRYPLLLAAFAVLASATPSVRAQGDSDAAFSDLDREERKSGSRKDSGNPQEDFRKAREQMRREVAENMRQSAEDFVKLSAQMEAQYKDLTRKMLEDRERLRKQMLQQWDSFIESSNKQWVDYGAKGDSRSDVDFEKGEVAVEVLVPVEDAAPGKAKAKAVSDLDAGERDRLKALAEEKIRAQMQRALSQKEPGKAEVLKDQVKAADGAVVTVAGAGRYVKEELAPRMQVEDKPVVAKDGKPRIKVTVRFDLAPGHLKVRAARYAPQVERVAKKYDLEPALVFAVIHTESEFNPMARSKAGALGLMQLVPRTAANEAYRYLYKEDKLVTPDYLYDPDNNIMLGATYLYMLKTRHYGKLKDPANQRTLSIAAYNCGPGNVRKAITSRYDVDSMTNDQVLDLVRKHAPKETQYYVPRVQERMALYGQM